ncbi:MAG: YqiA/YcfP family alpha/beta fold hydrolase [Chromatiales bacterium]|jgi:predicted esterase YcpF (UPF0227 family)
MIVYLHGLSSAGSSHKASVLRERLAPIPLVSPTYPAHLAAQAVHDLSRELARWTAETAALKQPLVLVGSSMGGFYGQFLARRFPIDHLVMINPALRPWKLLKQVVGWHYNQPLDQRYFLSSEMVEATRPFRVASVCDGVPTTLLLDQGDELIDWRIAAAIYRDCGELHCFEGGSHAFEHLDEAVEMLARIYRGLQS